MTMRVEIHFFSNWKKEEYPRIAYIFYLFGVTIATIKGKSFWGMDGIEIHTHFLNFQIRVDFIFLPRFFSKRKLIKEDK